MLPSTTVVISGLWLYNKSNKHIFCNKRFKAFLEGQTNKEKPTSLLTIKNLHF